MSPVNLCQQLAFAWRHCVPCIRPWVSGPACYSSAYYLWTAHCALYQTMDINLGMLFFCILFLNSTLCPISGHGYLSGLAILLHSVFQQRNVPYIWPCMPFLFCISCLCHCWLFSLQSFTHMLSSHCLNPTSLSQNQKHQFYNVAKNDDGTKLSRQIQSTLNELEQRCSY